MVIEAALFLLALRNRLGRRRLSIGKMRDSSLLSEWKEKEEVGAVREPPLRYHYNKQGNFKSSGLLVI